VSTWKQKADGTDEQNPSEDLILSPPILKLAPKARQVVRLARIAQGDVLGFVGQTGWATGPHLHYEFRIAGQSRNPYAIAMPAGEPVPPADVGAFRRHAEPLLARLELLAANPIALLE